MSKSRYSKIRPSQVNCDPRFQRELDERRAKRMSKAVNKKRIGVPVLSQRADGTFWVLDGQHRITALKMAGDDEPVLCDIQEGLTLADEAELFLLLNSDRPAVRVFDKFKARLVAKDPVAVEIERTVKAAGLRISKAPGANCICAIKALESTHNAYHNLPRVLSILGKWADGDPVTFDGRMLQDMGHFLASVEKLDERHLVERLLTKAPARVLAQITRTQGVAYNTPRREAAAQVFCNIYNYRLSKAKKIAPRAA